MQSLVIAVCTVVAVGGMWVVFARHRRLPSVLQSRSDLTPSELYRQFYPDLGVPLEQFALWWEEIGRAFEVPAGRIRPTDRFGIELPIRPVFGTSDEDMFLSGALRRFAGKTAVDSLPELRTVDQFIRF